MKTFKSPLLYAPNSYWKATKQQKDEICNGCGAKGGLKVPNTFYGLSIKEACNIHDWMYNEVQTFADFLFANAMFLLNLVTLILHASNWFTKILRLSRATKYFLAVALKGEDAYWVNKKRNSLMHITYKGSFR